MIIRVTKITRIGVLEVTARLRTILLMRPINPALITGAVQIIPRGGFKSERCEILADKTPRLGGEFWVTRLNT